MICIIDYGAGNIESVWKALEHLGADCIVSSEPSVLAASDRAVLPGVGSFGDAMDSIRNRGLEKPIKDFISSGKPFLGICLGLQVLFESSEESPGAEGLGVLKGEVVRFPRKYGQKIPHMGWNSLNIEKDSGMFKGLDENPYVYFVHSYYLKAKDNVVSATTEYGVRFHAAVCRNNVWACQFHPEKSGKAGLQILKNFIDR